MNVLFQHIISMFLLTLSVKFRVGFNVGQGYPILLLEGYFSAEFSSDLLQHTFLEVSSDPKHID